LNKVLIGILLIVAIALAGFVYANGDTTWDTNTLPSDCYSEGQSVPVIADPLACCPGLDLIKPTNSDLVGSSGYCTAKCGDGICGTIETSYNCPEDCPAERECVESDNGLDYYVRGTANPCPYGPPCGMWVDQCLDDTTLLEYSCDNLDGVRYSCPDGCRDGACIVRAECRTQADGCIPSDVPCCRGLNPVSLAVESSDGACAFAKCGTICLPCGNGVCDDRENSCNCPEKKKKG